MEINQVKRGFVLQLNAGNGKLSEVLSIKQKSQARGPSHYKIELKDLKSGAKIFERINSGNNVEVVELTSRKLQFLYSEDAVSSSSSSKILNLMDPETFEEISVSSDIISAASGAKAVPFLQAESIVQVESFDGEAISLKIPDRGTFRVVECEPVRGNSTESSSSFKNAVLENEQTITVPDFVKEGDSVVVDLASLIYKERVKETGA